MGNGLGRFLVHGLSRERLSSLVLSGLAVVVFMAALPAFADTPETGTDPSVTVTVTPSDFLTDGQVVTLTGAGFPANTAGTVRQCGGSVDAPECDLTVSVAFVTTATGDIAPTSVAVERIIDTGTTTFNCGVQACALLATAGGKTSQHHIMMAGAGTSLPSTTVATTTTTVVSPGGALTIDATAWSSGLSLRVTGTIACAEGRRYRIELTVTQGDSEATARRTGSCRGDDQAFRANVRNTAGPGFEEGMATVDAIVEVGDPRTREIVETFSTSEEVELVARGGFLGDVVSALSIIDEAGGTDGWPPGRP